MTLLMTGIGRKIISLLKRPLGDDVNYLLERWNNTDCEFEFNEDDVGAKAIVDKIRALPIGERLWPNCLGKPIRNTGHVNIEKFIFGSKKTQPQHETTDSKKSLQKSAVNRNRSKQLPAPVIQPSPSAVSLSSESQESPKSVKEGEMSSGRIYVKVFPKYDGSSRSLRT
ncbi:uncharacterized protein LOC141693488 [Apium graveolens]|uniref:uncharacterized protein LOC141693488 n=1 Tax=Apium graveolens TaxID=4045 RepID=UPI003D7ACFD5